MSEMIERVQWAITEMFAYEGAGARLNPDIAKACAGAAIEAMRQADGQMQRAMIEKFAKSLDDENITALQIYLAGIDAALEPPHRKRLDHHGSQI